MRLRNVIRQTQYYPVGEIIDFVCRCLAALSFGMGWLFFVDKNLLKVLHGLLDGMRVPESDINTVVFKVAATCAKHYKSGYMEAQQSNK